MTRSLLILSFFACVSGCSGIRGEVTGPEMPSPGPMNGRFHGEWHRDALGEAPSWVQVNRPPLFLTGFQCTGGSSDVLASLDQLGRAPWAQEDVFRGESASNAPEQRATICVFHPYPDTQPASLIAQPRRLASGALEGDLWEAGKKQTNGAVFLLEAGVMVVARGTAVERVRERVAKNPSPPPPLPIAKPVQQWTYDADVPRSLRWLHFDGTKVELYLHDSESAARSAYETHARTLAVVREAQHGADDGRRLWLHGTDLYVYAPAGK